jgi:propanediol dehydratase small subunit
MNNYLVLFDNGSSLYQFGISAKFVEEIIKAYNTKHKLTRQIISITKIL